MRQAVILAGGKGTRLAERLNGRPKPLVDVDGIPLLERQVRELARFGIEEAVVLVNHAADQIDAFFAARTDLGCQVRLIDDGVPAGTAGATLACLDALHDQFLVIYGDTLFNIDIARFLAAHAAAGADATLFLHPNDHPHDSDLVEIDDDGRITRFHGYPHPDGVWLPNLVNAAFYAIEKKALKAWRDFKRPSDFAKDLFPAMAAAGAHLHGYRSFEYIKDLGTPKRLDKVEKHLRSGLVARASLEAKQACVFLDRDGTLNVQRDFVRKPEDLDLIPGADVAVRMFNDGEFRTALITNQPVIARGDTTVAGLRQIHAKLDTLLSASGGFLDTIHYCPHHPDGGFPGEIAALKIACACRKPGTLLLERAAAELNADLSRSWMVGDSTADLTAANRFGVAAVLVRTGSGGRDGKSSGKADFIVDDVLEAARLICILHPQILAQTKGTRAAITPGDLVVIGGQARAGKSTTAASLAYDLRQRGMAARTVSLDHWIIPPDQRGDGVFGRFDTAAARAELAPWLAGNSLETHIPSYDRRRRAAGPETVLSVQEDDVLIVEGVPALAVDWGPTQRRIHTIFVAGDEAARAERVIDDVIARGHGDRDAAEQTYQARTIDECLPIDATREHAQIVIYLDGGQT